MASTLNRLRDAEKIEIDQFAFQNIFVENHDRKLISDHETIYLAINFKNVSAFFPLPSIMITKYSQKTNCSNFKKTRVILWFKFSSCFKKLHWFS